MSVASLQDSEVSATLSAPTVPAAFQLAVAMFGPRTALRSPDNSLRLTWSELGGRVREVAAGLARLGVAHGDTLAVILPNTPECHIVDYAASHLGAVPFAVFNSSPAVQIEHQLRNADARVVVTQREFLPKVTDATRALGGQVGHIVLVDTDEPATDGSYLTLAEVVATADPAFDFDAAWRAVEVDDLATLIYTSGTTGPPKGAQWSHRTVMAAQRAMAAALPIASENLVSFLPMAHAGGRITVHYMALVNGATITTCPDARVVAQVLAEVHPDAFFSVPRFWEKLQVAIEGMAGAEPDEERRAALLNAIEVGLRRVYAEETGSGASAEEVAQLVAEHEAALGLLAPILTRLGLDRVKSGFVGGAPSTPGLSQFFRAVGVPMLEAYGLTEGSLNVFNRVKDFKSGTAGKALPGVELRLGEDGELLARSELNFVGYRKEPEATAAALDDDGWLHTGDIARIDEDGFVSIVDRKKELIINSAGKNMSPVLIESAVKGASSLIGQVLAVGDRRKYVTAIITLDPEAASNFARRNNLEDQSLVELVTSDLVRREIESAVAKANEQLHGNEQIKKFVVLPVAWQPDSDELTATAKLRRKPIQAKYAEEIEQMYDS